MRKDVQINVEEGLSPVGSLYIIRVGNEQARILSIGGGMKVPLTDDIFLQVEIIQKHEEEG